MGTNIGKLVPAAFLGILFTAPLAIDIAQNGGPAAGLKWIGILAVVAAGMVGGLGKTRKWETVISAFLTGMAIGVFLYIPIRFMTLAGFSGSEVIGVYGQALGRFGGPWRLLATVVGSIIVLAVSCVIVVMLIDDPNDSQEVTRNA